MTICKYIEPFTSYPSCLKPIIDQISSDIGVRTLLKITGPVHIKISDCKGHKSIFSAKKKTITLSPQLFEQQKSKANQIAYIIFELCNAFQLSDFKKKLNGERNVDAFVLNFEKLEHQSALLTQKIVLDILGSGIDFDFQNISHNFKVHYILNQISGHSEWIASTYFPKQYYRGTLFYPLSELDQKARDFLYTLFYYRFYGTELEFKNVKIIVKSQFVFDKSCQKAWNCFQNFKN